MLGEESGHLRRFKKKAEEQQGKLMNMETHNEALQKRLTTTTSQDLPALQFTVAKATELATEIREEFAGLVPRSVQEEYVTKPDEEPTTLLPTLGRIREFLVAMNIAFDHASESADEAHRLQKELA
eukprot:1887956-Prymnesium_polylepis.1